MYWNGELVHNDVEITGPTGSAAAKGEPAPDRAPDADGMVVQVGPLRLQEHHSEAKGPVRYRNVWIAPIASKDVSEGDWTPLFDGETLKGWQPRGGAAEYRMEKGELVGTCKPNTPNTFLVSEREYGDFEMIFEVKQNKELNSGVQIRSHVKGAKDGSGIGERDGRVFGYQCELDPSERAYSGGVYEEGRRGWLFPLIDNPSARVSYKPGEWNVVRIRARGPRIDTWVNGVPAANMFDAMDASGHIAFQVHDVGSKTEAMEVRFRNLRIRELE